ncbi:hypothetical protein Tco_1374199 [Tanacetum coccineum]
MADLKFYVEHNKVAFLEKTKRKSDGFHDIIDFINSTPIRYALVNNPIVREWLVRQFWATALEVSLPDGAVGIEATIDGHAHTITEASIRSSLRLNDQGATVCLPTDDIYSGLAAIGYVPDQGVWRLCFFKNKFSPQWKFLVHTLIHCIDSKASSISAERVDDSAERTDAADYTISADEDVVSVAVGIPAESSGLATSIPSPFFTTSTVVSTATVAHPSTSFAPSTVEKASSPLRDPTKGKDVAEPTSPDQSLTTKELEDQHAAILEAERQEAFEMEARQSQVAEQIYYDSLLAQRLVEEEERVQRDKAELSSMRQTELDAYARNLTDAEWVDVSTQLHTNPTLAAEILGSDVNDDNFMDRVLELMRKRRKELAAQKAKEKCEKPMTQAQQRDFMRTFVKNQSTAVYTVGWSMTDVRSLDDAHLLDEYNKIRRALDRIYAQTLQRSLKRSGDSFISSEPKRMKVAQPSSVSTQHSPSSISAAKVFISADAVKEDIPSGTTSPRRSGRKKTFTKKKATSSTTTPTLTYYYIEEGDPDAEYKQYLRYTSDEDVPSVDLSQAVGSDLAHWEVLSTDFGLGEIHLVRWADGSERRFTTYADSPASGLGLDLWGSLRNLIAASETYDASIVWHDQDQWQIHSWRFMMLLDHGLEIDSYSLRTNATSAVRLIRSLLEQLNPSS